MILAQPELPTDIQNVLRLVIFAQNVTPDQLAEWERRFAAPLMQIYGMTETMGQPLTNPLHGVRDNMTIGLPTLGYECRVVDPNGIAPPQTASRPIHETELILKLTTDYITEGENLASNSSAGLEDRPLDYVQGYGLVNAQRAVAVALALQELRDPDRDGFEDAEVTVFDALERWEATLLNGTEERDGEGLRRAWLQCAFSASPSRPIKPVNRRTAGTTVNKIICKFFRVSTTTFSEVPT
mgnify:CR=1 FL=1